MANEEHVAILKQGVEVWNKWRVENINIMPDLSRAKLREMDLGEIETSETMMGMTYIATYTGGKTLPSTYTGNEIRQLSEMETDAGIRVIPFRMGANLTGANLTLTNLHRTDLTGAKLQQADLTNTNLSEANLCEADLAGANLRMVNLREANLTEANLTLANLRTAKLRRANLTGARCSYTTFGNVDLSQVKGLDTVKHNGPSHIDIQSIYRSGGNISEVFLRGAGVPDTFITFMKSLTGQPVDFYSCFISHSSKDREFVERLYADLQSNGVRCWYAPEDLKIGEPFLLGIDQGIRLHDKLLLVLSENSVGSGWVQHEVLSAMAKEQGKEPWVLFPIRLDNAVMETDVPWANMIRQSRHVGDFTRWKDHDSYRKAFDKLLSDLKGKS